jgi:hypothetical protein
VRLVYRALNALAGKPAALEFMNPKLRGHHWLL